MPTSPAQTLNFAKQYVRLLYESPHFIALSKPPNLIVQHTPGATDSVDAVLREIHPRFFQSRPDPFHAPKTVHRLDVPVSGCLLMGTSWHGTRNLANAFKKNKVEKGYLALLSPRELRGRDQASILTRRKEGVVLIDDCTTAWTLLRILGKEKTPTRYLVWLQPREGRKHQLRIACSKGLEAPVTFDRMYGYVGRESEKMRDEGIALHCATLQFGIGLDRFDVRCEPPDIGIWRRMANEYNIDWSEIIDLAATQSHGIH